MKTHLARLMRRAARALIAQSRRLDPPKAETVDQAAAHIVAAQERLAKAQRDYGRAVAAKMACYVCGDTQRPVTQLCGPTWCACGKCEITGSLNYSRGRGYIGGDQ